MNQPVPCADKWELFDSTDLVDHVAARRICRECPLLAACQQRLEEARRDQTYPGATYGPQGTWAGELLSPHPIPNGAADWLDDFDETSPIWQLAELIARGFKTTPYHLLGTTRRTEVTDARHVMWWVLRARGMSLPEIGRAVGRDHTTILRGCQKVDARDDLYLNASVVHTKTRQLEEAA